MVCLSLVNESFKLHIILLHKVKCFNNVLSTRNYALVLTKFEMASLIHLVEFLLLLSQNTRVSLQTIS